MSDLSDPCLISQIYPGELLLTRHKLYGNFNRTPSVTWSLILESSHGVSLKSIQSLHSPDLYQ
jgi:hypothetical protein